MYEAAKNAKLSGSAPPRVDCDLGLKTQTWEEVVTGHDMDQAVINGIKHGFAMQYTGPPRYGPSATYNHSSAMAFASHIDEYIQKEVHHGALEGPYDSPPFTPWFYTSPIMTREKDNGEARRIIVDLSFPDGGLNAHITPHIFEGRPAVHNLPTIDSAVDTLSTLCPGDIQLAVVDLSRAYRQFPVDPLDWPLLGIYWRNGYAFDRRLPFGARMSSFVMQTIADFLVRALEARGVVCHMYLDDILIMAPAASSAQRMYQTALKLLDSLGLQVAIKKLQPPAPRVTWLGIDIDIPANMLAITTSKLDQIRTCMVDASSKRTITKKALQRLVGLANHLGKVVRAARIFVCRVLAALRATTTDHIRVTRPVRADLRWFTKYLVDYNGRSIIPNNKVVARIWADACLVGAGASDGSGFYEYVFPPDMAESHHITLLEALNCVAAVRVFVTSRHGGGTIQVFCDNQPSVDALTSGRARNATLAACARAMWYHAAKTDTHLVFTHVPGEGMSLPDALSRASMSQAARNTADTLISSLALTPVPIRDDHFSYDLEY